jgi:hypothetical protein
MSRATPSPELAVGAKQFRKRRAFADLQARHPSTAHRAGVNIKASRRASYSLRA